MSPRRRLVFVVAAVLAALAVIAGLVAARGGAEEVAGPPQDLPGPVLLVPGYGGGTGALEGLRRRLTAAGRQATIVRSIGDGTGDLREQARELQREASALVAAGAPSVDVVGYSAGGVVARLWVADEGGDRLARRVVTLGSPHHGTDVARLGATLAPGRCPEACRQLVPGSELLDGLPETPGAARWTSVWTDRDEVVTPPDTARLDDAVNVPLQDVCPDDAAQHGDLPADALAVGIVLRALAVDPLTEPPGPADCAGLRG